MHRSHLLVRRGPGFAALTFAAALTVPVGAAERTLAAPGAGLVAVESSAGIALATADGARSLSVAPAGRLASFAAVDDRWALGVVGSSPERETLELSTGTGLGSVVRLPEPAVDGPLLMDATLVVDADGPRWALWFDARAANRASLRAARWNGAGWDGTVTLSPVGPGTQIALDVAPLPDGGWLAVWAAWDGEDDEILWSRGDADGWTAPLPLEADDAAPDITPRLLASGNGVHVAWSEKDGREYRSRIARFDGTGWSDLAAPGPPGAIEPRLAEVDGRLVLVERAAWPRGWWVTELDEESRAVRRARFPAEAAASTDALRIESVGPGGVVAAGERAAWAEPGDR